MKRLIICFTLLLVLALNACKKENSMDYGSEFGRSFLAWQEFKKTSNDSYTYQVTSGSWTGTGTETTITVVSGKVTARTYVMYSRQYNSPVVIVDDYTEKDLQVGTHDKGAVPSRLDEIYEQAKNDWLRKRDNAQTYFEAKNDGMISLCGYVENSCQDDCLVGISIKYIKAL